MSTTLDDLLPAAADCRNTIAEVEAKKATEYLRKKAAAEAEKRRCWSSFRSPRVSRTKSG